MNKFTLILLASIFSFTAICSVSADDGPTLYRLQNRWLHDRYLFDDSGKASYGYSGGDNYLWSIEDHNGVQLIKNKQTGNYLGLKGDSAELETTYTLDTTSSKIQWNISVVAGDWKAIQSVANKCYVNIEHQLGYAICDMGETPSDSNRWSEQWKFAYFSGPPPPHDYPNNLVSVISPLYGSDIKGDTTVSIIAPGLKSAVVHCWRQGDGYGSDSKVDDVMLDDNGKGSFVFPGDSYPHGPITVRIAGANGDTTDTCNLQLYNRGGVSWNEGIPKDIPPAAQDMKLVYADDFNKPLSISKTGAGATYSSHKPGGGDFGNLSFSDIDSQNTPFLQVDNYLRIRADANKGSAGLISSLRMDGTGVTATMPCYFECRFISQSAPGTWPAFWVMTQGTYKGLQAPADELDIIEGYGGSGSGNPNQNGYWTTSHTWNQPDEPGVYRQNPMDTIGGKSTWWQTFHTYGCLISNTDTIYYCDNIEMARHPTLKMCKTDPMFFFINLAAGGNGWPIDLSRYNGIADMYVDYVRVFQGQKK